MPEPALLSRRNIASAIPFVAAAFSPAASSTAAPTVPDPIFAQIERHKALRIRAATVSEDDPVYQAAQDHEEDAIQALGNIMPVSIAGAPAQLAYMAEVEGDFGDQLSPLLRTVLSVSAGLTAIEGRTS